MTNGTDFNLVIKKNGMKAKGLTGICAERKETIHAWNRTEIPNHLNENKDELKLSLPAFRTHTAQ